MRAERGRLQWGCAVKLGQWVGDCYEWRRKVTGDDGRVMWLHAGRMGAELRDHAGCELYRRTWSVFAAKERHAKFLATTWLTVDVAELLREARS